MNEQQDQERAERLWDLLQEAERDGGEPDISSVKAQFEAACARLLWISDGSAAKPAGLDNVTSVYEQVTERRSSSEGRADEAEVDVGPRRAV